MDSQVLAVVATGFAAWAGVTSIFWKLEEIVHRDVRQQIAKWLKGSAAQEVEQNWASYFVMFFDDFFGSRHLSWRCFIRCSLASIFAVIIIIFIWATIAPSTFVVFVRSSSADVIRSIIAISSVILVNLIPDYFSLLGSRYIFDVFSRSKSSFVKLMFFVFDIALSLIIFSPFLIILYYYTVYFDRSVAYDKAHFFFVNSALKMETWFQIRGFDVPPVGVFLYSTLLATVLAWTYAISCFVIRRGYRTGLGLQQLAWLFDVDRHPLRSIGFVAGGLACVGYWLLAVTSFVIVALN